MTPKAKREWRDGRCIFTVNGKPCPSVTFVDGVCSSASWHDANRIPYGCSTGTEEERVVFNGHDVLRCMFKLASGAECNNMRPESKPWCPDSESHYYYPDGSAIPARRA